MDLHAVVDLHRALTALAPEDDDLTWSPYSIFSALGLAADGAAGETRDELLKAIGDTPPDLLRQASELSGSEIAATNTLWSQRGLPILQSYEESVRSWPGGALNVSDFATAPETARQEINADVEKTTRGMIRNLLGPTDVDADTLTVLVNAVWLRLRWAQPFDASLTEPQPFHAPARTYDTPTMTKVDTLPYARIDGWQGITLVAKGGVSCDILLPDDPAAIVHGPTADELTQLRKSTHRTRVDLRLPRFELDWRTELAEALSAVGVRRVFTADADLSRMSEVPLRVDKAIHQAAMKLDEEGAEAAAATAVIGVRAAFFPERDPLLVQVDRPFMAVLRHSRTSVVYFLARVVAP